MPTTRSGKVLDHNLSARPQGLLDFKDMRNILLQHLHLYAAQAESIIRQATKDKRVPCSAETNDVRRTLTK